MRARDRTRHVPLLCLLSSLVLVAMGLLLFVVIPFGGEEEVFVSRETPAPTARISESPGPPSPTMPATVPATTPPEVSLVEAIPPPDSPVAVSLLEGTVVDEAGMAVPSASIKDLGSRSVTVTDDRGRFTLPRRGKELPTVSVSAKGYIPLPILELSASSSARIVLDRGGGIEGRVLTEKGLPAPGYSFWIDRAGRRGGRAGRRIEVQDEEGRFQVSGLRPGLHVVRVDGRESGLGTGRSEPVFVESTETVEGVTVRLGSPVGLVGTIIDSASYAPVADASVTWTLSREAPDLRARGGRGGAHTVSDAEGRFELRDVPADASLVITHDLYLTATERLGPSEGRERLSLEIQLIAGASIQGMAYDDEGLPRIGSRVLLMADDTGRPLDSTRTGEDGSYALNGLESGRYGVGLLSEGGTPYHTFVPALDAFETVTVAAGEVASVDLGGPAAGGARVFGQVLSSGVAVPDLLVELTSEGAPGVDAVASLPRCSSGDDGGWFVFDGVTSGRHLLCVRIDGQDVLRTFRVEGESELRVDLVVPDAALEVRVQEASTGAPVDSVVTVRSASADGETDEASRLHQRTGADGVTTFAHLGGGLWEVTVCSRITLLGGADASHTVERFTVTLEEGEDHSLDVTLDRGGALEGRIQGVGGRPVSGAEVEVLDRAGNPAGLRFRSEEQDAGQYSVRGLPPGEYTVCVTVGGHELRKLRDVSVTAGKTSRLDVSLTPR